MAEAIRLQGMDAISALMALLATRLRPIEPAAAREALGTDPRPDDLTQALERHGFQTRWSQIEARDFRHLELPTLLAQSEGRYVIALERRGSRVLCQGVEGVPGLHDLEELMAFCQGSVLDICPPLPEGSLWSRIFRMVLAQRQSLYPILWIALLTQALGLLTPHFTRLLVDQALPHAARSLFAVLILGTLTQGAFLAWMGWVQSRFVIYLEKRLGFFIEQGLFAHLLRLPFPYLSTKSVGDLLQGFYGLTSAQEFLTGSVLSTLVNNLTTLGYLVMMAQLMPAATGVVVLVSGGYVGITILVSRHLARLQAASVEAQAKERSFLSEMLNGLPIIKASGAEQRAEARWWSLYQRKRRIGLYSQRFNLTSMGVLGLFQGLFNQTLIIWGGFQVLRGELQVGEMLAFTMMAASFHGALAGAGSLYVQLMMMKPQLDKVRDILDVPSLPPPRLGSAQPLRGPVLLQDLWFRYNPEVPWTLRGLQLEIQPGEKILVRGPSGCGKSTLLKLIAGLYSPERGSISLAGAPPDQARHLLAYLPQFVQLFDGSILENLRLLSGAVSRDRLMQAAEDTGLDRLVSSLPMGYETLISSGGHNFSGGQKQLIALTAVLASHKSVLLLDEAMANMDPILKAQLFKSPLFLGKTMIFASHEEGQEHSDITPDQVRIITLAQADHLNAPSRSLPDDTTPAPSFAAAGSMETPAS